MVIDIYLYSLCFPVLFSSFDLVSHVVLISLFSSPVFINQVISPPLAFIYILAVMFCSLPAIELMLFHYH